MTMNNSYFLRVEGVNIYDTVTDTNQLSTVRGGSLLLREAIFKVRHLLVTKGWGTPVSIGASVGLFELNGAADRGAVEKEVTRLLRGEKVNSIETAAFRHLTFVVDVQGERLGKDFADAREAVLAKNRFRQMCQLTAAVPEDVRNSTGPCGLDGVRPAGQKSIREKEVSPSVWDRYEYGREGRQKFYKDELKHVSEIVGSTEDKITRCAESQSGFDQSIADKLLFTDDLRKIADAEGEKLNGKIAVLYFDGNGFGRIQRRHCETPDDLRDFDRCIQTKRGKLLYRLLEKFKGEARFKNGDALRLETLLWGGDEMMFVVPAWMGLEVLHFIYDCTKGWKFAGEDLTHAGGLVFCHHKTPISRMTALARQLGEWVKEQPGGRQGNKYDYVALESIDFPTESLECFWERRVKGYADFRTPVAAPEDWDTKRDGLTRAMGEGVARAQIYEILRKALAAGAVVSDHAEFKSQFEERLRRVATDKKVEAVLTAVDSLFPASAPFWRWAHLVELWDYMGLDET
jgi:hypothetical protein